MFNTRRSRKVRRQQCGGCADTGESLTMASWRQRALGSSWTPFGLALISAVLFWAALPPLNLWLLGWVAPIGYLTLIRLEELPGRRPYAGMYFSSVLFWALTMQGIRLAHWANYLGLVALSLYLGIYVPAFIAIARVAYQRWSVPLIISAPVAWVGVEVGRGYGPLGFSMALLAHTQVKQSALIQVADLFGAYAISFVVMFVSACAVCALPRGRRGWAWWPAVPMVALLLPVLIYGWYRLEQWPSSQSHETSAPLRIALIQGSIDTTFDSNPDRPRVIYEQYSELTSRALERFGRLDLVMWPEAMFPLRDVQLNRKMFANKEARLYRALIDEQRDFRRLVEITARRLNQPADGSAARHPASWVFGTTTWKIGPHQGQRYNAAMLADHHGEITGRYYKMHPVIFGEYVPFGDLIPALYNLFPLPNGLTPGCEPVAWEVKGTRLSPSICFESTIPHLIRWQVAQLARQGQNPHVLINLTNDGWFWGSSILDLQLNCAVMRAVELRRPFVIAANTGFSASIDGNGTVLVQGPRRATDVLLAEVVPDPRRSWYEMWGDGPVLCCTVFCLLVAGSGAWSGWRTRRRGAAGNAASEPVQQAGQRGD